MLVLFCCVVVTLSSHEHELNIFPGHTIECYVFLHRGQVFYMFAFVFGGFGFLYIFLLFVDLFSILVQLFVCKKVKERVTRKEFKA